MKSFKQIRERYQRMSRDTIVQDCKREAALHLELYGDCIELPPLLFTARGAIAVPMQHPPGWERNETKDAHSRVLHQVAEETCPYAFAMVAESWYIDDFLEEHEQWLAEHGTISSHPDRKSMVRIYVEHEDAAPTTSVALIENGELGKWQDCASVATGRYGGFVQQRAVN